MFKKHVLSILIGLIIIIQTPLFYAALATDFKYSAEQVVNTNQKEIQNNLPKDYLDNQMQEEISEVKSSAAERSENDKSMHQIMGIFLLFGITMLALGVISMNLHR